MLRIIIILLVWIFATHSWGTEALNHAVARVKKGENIEKLLKRYLLTPHNCNIEAFCEINQVKKKNKIFLRKLRILRVSNRFY